VIDTNTNDEKQILADGVGAVTGAAVTGDDEVTITYDSYGGIEVRYRISTGFRA